MLELPATWLLLDHADSRGRMDEASAAQDKHAHSSPRPLRRGAKRRRGWLETFGVGNIWGEATQQERGAVPARKKEVGRVRGTAAAAPRLWPMREGAVTDKSGV